MMGRLIASLGLAVGIAACQPLYGAPPERPYTPDTHKPPATPVVEVAYVEDCNASFQDDPHKWHPQPQLATPLVNTGDTVIETATKTTDETAKVELIRDAIGKYRSALIKDPYNADATLKLALAYDKVLRKGCALALLRRLDALSGNPKYASAAVRSIDAVDFTPRWFKAYRKDALKAIGR